jgi:hypothetical protein
MNLSLRPLGMDVLVPGANHHSATFRLKDSATFRLKDSPIETESSA